MMASLVKSLAAVAVLSLAPLAATQAVAQTRAPTPAMPSTAQEGPKELQVSPGSWTPGDTGVTFPETVGEYERTRVVQYGTEDWSVGYNLYRGGKLASVVTVYLYSWPEAVPCDRMFEDTKAAVVNGRPGAVLADQDVVASPRGGQSRAARRARYSFTMEFGGGVQTPVHSDAYLYCKPDSRWRIKYRATWPAEIDRSDDAATILQAIGWPPAIAD